LSERLRLDYRFLEAILGEDRAKKELERQVEKLEGTSPVLVKSLLPRAHVLLTLFSR
jgi:hypothetical protein